MPAYDNVALASAPNIAGAGNYAAMLMQGLQAIPQEYYKGQEARYQQQQRDLFKDPANQAQLNDALNKGDYAALMKTLIQSGGAQSAGQLLPSLIDLQQQGRFYQGLTGQPGGQQPVNTSPATQPAASGPANITGATQPRMSSAGMDSAGAETLQSLGAGIAGGRDVNISGAVQNAARMMGVDPNQPLSAGQEAQARRLFGVSIGSGGQPPQPNPVPQSGLQDEGNVNQQVPNGSMGGGGPISPAPTSASGNLAGAPSGGRQPLRVTVGPGQQSPASPASFDDRFAPGNAAAQKTPLGGLQDAERLDAMADHWYKLSSMPRVQPAQAEAARKLGDAAKERAKQIRDTLQQYGSPQYNPGLQGQLHRFEGASKAVGDQIGEYVKAMPAARQMVNQLDVMEDAVKSAKGGISTGPGADTILKMKQFIANWTGENVKGLSEAETIVKMNAYLASEAAKQMTNRPSQMEFKAFMANNPGIHNSIQGTAKLIDILRQTSKQTIGLGRLGMNEQNWSRWGDVEDQFFQQNPIKLPFSGNAAAGLTQGAAAPGKYTWTPDGGLQRQ